MKKLVVYYSFEGNTEFIAEKIAEAIKAETLVLKPEKEIKTHGFMKYFWGGRQVMMKQKPKLLPFDKKAEDYDLIIIGTPVWAFNFSPPLATFFSQVKLKNKKIALYCCHEGGMGNTLDNMKKELAGNEIVEEADFLAPLTHDKKKSAKKAIDWVRKLI